MFKSSIHSFGIFTSKLIQLGELIIIEYVGEIIRSNIADLREQASLNNNYMFRINCDTIIDESRFENISRFLNHSCSVRDSFYSPFF
jgi:SET domain-containing protein